MQLDRDPWVQVYDRDVCANKKYNDAMGQSAIIYDGKEKGIYKVPITLKPGFLGNNLKSKSTS